IREDIARNALRRRQHLREAPLLVEEEIAHHQEGPAVAEDVQRSANRTRRSQPFGPGTGFRSTPEHDRILAVTCKSQQTGVSSLEVSCISQVTDAGGSDAASRACPAPGTRGRDAGYTPRAR